jgi:hypothetical protein
MDFALRDRLFLSKSLNTIILVFSYNMGVEREQRTQRRFDL